LRTNYNLFVLEYCIEESTLIYMFKLIDLEWNYEMKLGIDK